MAPLEPRGASMRTLLASFVVTGLAALLFVAGSRSSTPRTALATAGQTMAPSPEAIEDGFEPRDIQTRAVGVAMVIGVAVIGVSIAGLIVMLNIMNAHDKAGPPLTAQQAAAITPPGPPLQGYPLDDIATLRKGEAATLTTYHWLGADHAAAQIPISRAMKLVIGASLDPQAPAAAGAPLATDPPAAAPQSGTAP